MASLRARGPGLAAGEELAWTKILGVLNDRLAEDLRVDAYPPSGPVDSVLDDPVV